jgi:hypothetical protein
MKSRIVLAFTCLLFAPTGATAASQEDQAACMNDAMTICGQFIPDRERVGACLYQNRNRLTPGCRTAMTRYVQPTAARARTTDMR